MTDPTMNAAELDTLPIGAVVLDHNGTAWQRSPYRNRWTAAGQSWPSMFLTAIEPFILIHPLTTERTEP